MSIVANLLLDWKIFMFGFGLLASVSLLDTTIAILPVSGLTFIICLVFTWFSSMCVTFVCLHKLLQKNEPLQLCTIKESITNQKRELKPNPEKVKALTKDIDKYFMSKWYVNISKNDDFTEESKLFLEEVITRLAEVQLSVNNKILLHGSLNIYLKHLKEFRRSLKRKEKYDGSVEDLYRYSHLCSTAPKPKQYFLHQLTINLLRHFINSELWNSLPCQVLVSILAKKLVSFLLNLMSNPEILNYVLLDLVASQPVREKYNLSTYNRICVSQYFDVRDSKEKSTEELTDQEKPVEVEDGSLKEDNQAVDREEKYVDNKEISPEDLTFPKNEDRNKDKLIVLNDKETNDEIKDKFSITQKPQEELAVEKRNISDPVKIHEPKRSRTTKTWRDSKDLTLGISLGQDPLDVLPITIESTKSAGKSSNFWDTARIDHYVEDSPAHAANLLLNEVKHTTHTTMEGLKSSIKPLSDATVHTLHNIKDLQESTVNNALHKIGDFQDEAAGVVEGILDFGRAGLRKGLRLTGLQDNIENAKASLHIVPQVSKPAPKKKFSKLIRSESPEKFTSDESLDSVWINPLQMDSPSFDGQILLENSKKSEDKEKKDLQIPFISMEQPHIGSPDPEYEDAADLASSIAKLRSLLQQRSSESSLSTPAISPMPPDEFGQKVTEAEGASDLDEVDGVMPSFYKFCAKTATGVLDKTLNTIKTALPSNIQGTEQSDNAWIFIQTDQNEAEILTRMKKLLTERKEYCTLDTEIDTAYEAIDSLDSFQQPTFGPNMEFEDELDDFEVRQPITKALVDIMCELLADTNSAFVQEPLVKAVYLFLGNSLEKFLISEFDRLMVNFCVNLIKIPEISNQNTLFLDMETFVDAILSSLPDAAKTIFGKNTLTKALTIFVSSLQIKKINEDVVLQIFELITMMLIKESNLLSLTASA